jgi:hypothetical protein
MTTFTLIDHPEYLTPAEPMDDASRRVMAILPFLTMKARRWLRQMPARVRHRHDIEDVLQELWAKLLDVDRHFDPAQSKYITYAGVVVDRHLQRLGDRLCQGPRTEPLDGSLSDSQAIEPVEAMERAEASREAAHAVREGLQRLGPGPAYDLLVQAFGIDREPVGYGELGVQLNHNTASMARMMVIRAGDALRAVMAS